MKPGTKIKFMFGGIERNCSVPFSLALAIEEASGVGLLSLAHDVTGRRAKISDVCSVIRATLAANGMGYTHKQVVDMLERDGILSAYKAASDILVQFFHVPEDAKAKKSKAPGEPEQTEAMEVSR